MKMRSKINDKEFLTKGKIYETDSQGYFTYDNGKKSAFQYFDNSDIDAYMPSCFEAVKEMTKDDLKVGDWVIKRNGNVEQVMPMGCLASEDGHFNLLSNINNDLTNALNARWDIVKVIRPRDEFTMCRYGFAMGEVIFEREEKVKEEPVKEVTVADIEKQLGYKVKIVKES